MEEKMHDKNKFKWLNSDLRLELFKILNDKMPRGRGKLKYRKPLEHLKYRKVNGKKHIVFICYYPGVDFIKKSIVLRKSGQYYTTFIGCCIREDIEILKWFDEAYEVSHYREFYEVLKDADPWAVFLQIPLVEMAAIVIDSLPQHVKIILNVYDTQLFILPDDSFLCRLEKELYKKIYCWTHKMPPEAIDEMRNVWNIQCKDYLVHSLPCKDFFAYPDVEEKIKEKELSIVFAGGVMPYHIAIKNGCGNHIFDPIIYSLSAQNIRFTIYVHQNARNMFWEEHERYFNMQKKLPKFHFCPGYPFFKLPEKLLKFHFGLIYDNIPACSFKKKHFKYNMATKFFSYLEAGIPILVYEEAEYMKEIVLQNEIGVIYDLNSLNLISKLLNECNYIDLCNNVDNFRNKYNLETNFLNLDKILNG